MVKSLHMLIIQVDKMDNNLKEILISIQSGIINLQNDMTEVKTSLKKIELTIELETNKKIDALFDGRVDEMRHRKENIEANAKVADLEMRVDNLQKAFKAS